MPDLAPPAATGQPTPDAPATTTISAGREAANQNDFNAFDKADRAVRVGQPLPDVEVSVVDTTAAPAKADAVPPTPPVPRTKQKDIDADERLRSRVAEAVSTATAATNAEITRLRAQLDATTGRRDAAPPAVTPPAAATTDPKPDVNDLAKYPDGHFDQQFITDTIDWRVREALRADRDTQQQQTRERQQHEAHEVRVREHDAQFTKFTERFEAAIAADSTLMDRLDPEFAKLEGSIKLKPGQRPTFGHIVHDVVLQSEHPVELLLHLSDRKEAERLSLLPGDAFYREIGRIEATFGSGKQSPTPPAGAVETSTLTAAPPPPPTLTRAGTTADPKTAAIARGDFATFDKLDVQERRARLTTA